MRFSLSLLSSTQGVDTHKEDEMIVASQIKEKLSSQNVAVFEELHNHLKDGVSWRSLIVFKKFNL